MANNQNIVEAEQVMIDTTSTPVATTIKDTLIQEKEVILSPKNKEGTILPPPPPPPIIKDDLDCVLPEGFGEGVDAIAEAPELEELQKEEEVFSMAEEMPIFPGCDSIDDYRTKKCVEIKNL